jgi:selenocysteine lyase/cysteine desulfurase
MSTTTTKTELECYFDQFRKDIIGINQSFESPFGERKIIYTDWTASGRLYRPIEEKLMNQFGPFVANTHTETTVSGTAMTMAYHEARHIIKHHVNANVDDILITDGTGMTGVVNKFQRILGLRIPENLKEFTIIPDAIKPIVFISHMEHHSNQTSWLETIADVEVIPANEEGLFCMEEFKILVDKYKDRSFKIASITSCSNVTGIRTPYHEVAKIMHQNNGVCFVDFACWLLLLNFQFCYLKCFRQYGQSVLVNNHNGIEILNDALYIFYLQRKYICNFVCLHYQQLYGCG